MKKEKIKDYNYSWWEWLRVFPQYKELEIENNKMSVQIDELTAKLNKTRKELRLALNRIKEIQNEK